MDELWLVKEAQKGDVTAFNRLILHYQGLAYNVAYRIMNDKQSAEDVTQEAFIAAYKSLNQCQGNHFKSWLLRIVVNRCYDELRRHKSQPQISIEELKEDMNGHDFLRSTT